MAIKKKYRNKKANEENKEKLQLPVSEVRKYPSKILLAGIIALFSFLLYSNTLGHKYTVDDVTVITANKIVQKGVYGFGEILTTPYRKGYWDRNENMYRPVSILMFALEWELAPGKPWLGHLINVILYSLTGFLIFYILSFLLKNSPFNNSIAFFSALIFAAHPIHTEVVANIKSRDEILALFFCLAALFSFVKHFDNEKTGWLILSLILYTVALFSKENAITFIIIFPLVIYFFRSLHWKRISLISLTLLIPAAIYFIVRFSVLHHLGAHDQVSLINNSMAGASGFLDRFPTAIMILGRYLLLLIFPHPLVGDYSYNQIPLVEWSSPLFILSLAVYLTLAYLVIKGFAAKNIYSFCIIYFFTTISIVSNILFLIEATMGERFLYMPSLGFCLAASFFLLNSFSTKKNNGSYTFSQFYISRKAALVLSLIIILFSVKTFSRNLDWKDNFTLLENDIKNAPNSAREQYAFGSALFVERAMTVTNPLEKQNYLNRAIHHLEKAVTIWPAYADAYSMLGKVYIENKQPQKAITAFQLAETNKNFGIASFYQDFAMAFGGAGDATNAILMLKKSLQFEPASAETYSNLGLYYTDLKQFDKAIEALNTAINLKPDFAKAYYNLGLAFAMSGRYLAAVDPFLKAIEIDREYTDAYNNLGNSYSAMGEYQKALSAYEKVLKLEPGHTKALQNISITYKILGDEEKSVYYMKKAAAVQ